MEIKSQVIQNHFLCYSLVMLRLHDALVQAYYDLGSFKKINIWNQFVI